MNMKTLAMNLLKLVIVASASNDAICITQEREMDMPSLGANPQYPCKEKRDEKCKVRARHTATITTSASRL